MISKFFAWLIAMCFATPIVWFSIRDMFFSIVINRPSIKYAVPMYIVMVFCFLVWLVLTSLVFFIF